MTNIEKLYECFERRKYHNALCSKAIACSCIGCTFNVPPKQFEIYLAGYNHKHSSTERSLTDASDKLSEILRLLSEVNEVFCEVQKVKE